MVRAGSKLARRLSTAKSKASPVEGDHHKPRIGGTQMRTAAARGGSVGQPERAALTVKARHPPASEPCEPAIALPSIPIVENDKHVAVHCAARLSTI